MFISFTFFLLYTIIFMRQPKPTINKHTFEKRTYTIVRGPGGTIVSISRFLLSVSPTHTPTLT